MSDNTSLDAQRAPHTHTAARTGYPSVDKPWLKYYDEEALNVTFPAITAYEYIRECNKDRMDSYAINFYGNRIKYSELFRKIDEAKRSLVALGIRHGDYVTFCMPTLPETIYLFYALNQLGAVSNFVDLRMNKERIAKYINMTESKLVVSYNGVIEKVYSVFPESTAKTLIDIDVTSSLLPVKKLLYLAKMGTPSRPNAPKVLTWKDFLKLGDTAASTEYVSDAADPSREPAAIVYTGGTTGEPKGAVLSNNSLNVPCIQYAKADIPRGYNDRFANIMPPFIAYGLVDGIQLPLSLGMENLLLPKFDPNEFSQILMKYKPAHFVGIPSHFEILMDDPRMEGKDLSFIKNAGCGGDMVSSSLEDRTNKYLAEHHCGSMMRVGYGMTENAAMSIYDLNNGMTKVGRIGIPMQQTTIGVFDEDGNELGYNQVGELRISSPAIINGYFKNEQETADTIIEVSGRRWIKTGDYAEIDEDGNVKIIGRKRAMFVRPDGHNVFPDLIRDYLAGCPIIKDVCVIGIKSKHNSHGKIPTAIVALKDGTQDKDKAKREILEYQSHLLGERDGAIDVRFRDELPMTPIGKIDVMKIEQEESQHESDIDFDVLTARKK